ncbi:hydantoinase B/oxoprolinase family protein [Pseudomonas sp. BN414]|uniref:hydantoinase B/oxoprolinase family protein n=1 Tax=Pseudomonas sp. BN414 TaxID=2567888 RepID=UPI0024584696|nr:hydantoinase B/oxoprolinase family protein [Pseudomonas sp. BN414]MDH4567104.1 hydantoinase B/oxoprolinase family protein [Pseudomonas sp. BN414]
MTDAITVAVVGSALKAVAGEMGDSLRRSAHSPIIREMLDYACALFTVAGESVAEDAQIPALLGSMSVALPMLLQDHPAETIRPGDIFIGNDPYRGCTHTPDIHLFAPVFSGDRLVAWVGNLAHHTDIGGTNPGTEGFANRSVYEEGLRFPWVRLVDSDNENHALLAYFANNTRDADSSLGDLRAQMAAIKLGVRRMQDLLAKYSPDLLVAVMAERLDQGERRMRSLLRSTPDSTGHAVGYLDNDGIDDQPVRIEVSLRLQGDQITVDFSGTATQMAGGMNCSRTATIAAVIFAIKSAFDPDGDQTGGCLRPLDIILPPGSAVNPAFPAAVSLRHLAAQRITDTLVRALSSIKPEFQVGGSFVGFSSLAAECRHPRNGRMVVMADDLGGGMGGHARGDGVSAVDPYLGNVAMLPMEICERQYPIRILRTELAEDSAGNGRHRGGLGIRREYEFLDTCDVVFYSEQTVASFAPWGAEGGQAGQPASLTLIRADGRSQTITKERLIVQAGDRLITTTAGGGGWGSPQERDNQAIERDIAEGKLSRERAQETYGL